jgi:hypothetical protein
MFLVFGFRFRVRSLGLRARVWVHGLGFMVYGVGFMVHGLRFTVYGFRV